MVPGYENNMYILRLNLNSCTVNAEVCWGRVGPREDTTRSRHIIIFPVNQAKKKGLKMDVTGVVLEVCLRCETYRKNFRLHN